MRAILKAMSNRDVAAALRIAKIRRMSPRVIEALTLEAFDRVLEVL